MLKKILVAIMFVGGLLYSNLSISHATDVWVDHWGSENIDIYIMDDTLSQEVPGKSFTISTKMVRNGSLQKVVTWQFFKYNNELWRYHTNTMSDHYPGVLAHNRVFEYGMQRLQWPYEIRNGMHYY